MKNSIWLAVDGVLSLRELIHKYDEKWRHQRSYDPNPLFFFRLTYIKGGFIIDERDENSRFSLFFLKGS